MTLAEITHHWTGEFAGFCFVRAVSTNILLFGLCYLPSDNLDLSDPVRVTEHHADLRRSSAFAGKLADLIATSGNTRHCRCEGNRRNSCEGRSRAGSVPGQQPDL